MTYAIVECSPQAKAKITNATGAPAEPNNHHRTKYPFDALVIGQCFCVPIAEANETSLRLTATKKGKATSKKFSVIKHQSHGVVEVARIA